MEQGILRGETLDIPHNSIPGLFQDLMKENGSHFTHCPAIITQGAAMTYSDVDIISDHWVSRLKKVFRRQQRQSIKKASEEPANLSGEIHHRGSKENGSNSLGQQVIGIFIPPNANRIVAMMSIFKFGGCYVPLDSTLPDQRIASILEETKCQMVLYETEEIHSILYKVTRHLPNMDLINVDKLPCTKADFVNTYNGEMFTCSKSDPVLCILYTSGSTGKPKGVPLRTSNMLNRLQWQWHQFPFSKNEIGCHKTSPLFVDSLTEILGCLLKGILLVIIPKCIVQNPIQLLNSLSKHCISRIVLVPTLLKMLITELKRNKDRRCQIETLKYVVCSGETLPEDLLHEFFEAFPPGITLLNYYGSTETTGDVTCEIYSSLDDMQGKVADGYISIGRPVSNNTIHVLNGRLQHVPDGELGEVYITGNNVVERYLTDKREGSFVELKDEGGKLVRLYRTGDWGLIQNGCLIYQGRQDSQVKVRGHRVNLREVENTIQNIPGVETVVTLACDTKAGFRPVAFFSTDIASTLSVKEVNETCRKHLPTYMLPVVMKLDSIPLQRHTGKIDRTKLKEIFLEAIKGKPVPKKEYSQSRIMLSIIAEEMGIPLSSIDTRCSFLELGGNSVAAVNASSVLQKEGFDVPVTEFFTNRSLSEMINAVEENENQLLLVPDIKTRFKVEMLSSCSDRDTVIPLLAKSFTEKNPLDLMAGTSLGESYALLESGIVMLQSFWNGIVTDDLSVCVRDTLTGNIVGAHAVVDLNTPLDPVFHMEGVGAINEDVENPVKDMCKKMGGRWVDSMFTGCDVTLPDSLVLDLLLVMEYEVIKVARERGYDGIVTVNSHPVTISIAEEKLGYELRNTLHVKSWEYKGTLPFHMADDSYYLKSYILKLK